MNVTNLDCLLPPGSIDLTSVKKFLSRRETASIELPEALY